MSNDFNFSPTRQGMSTTMKWLLVGAILAIVLSLLGYAIYWVTTPLRLTDPDRLQRISQEANDAYAALQSQKANIGTLREKLVTYTQLYGEDQSKWPQGKDEEYLQLRAQLTNMIVAYNGQCADYRAKWANEWWEFSAPKDLPTTCELIE